MGTIGTIFKSFQRGWRILAIFTVAFAIGSLVWSTLTTPLYRATAKFLVYPNANLTSSRDIVSSLDTLDNRTISTTYADILSSSRVYQDTVNRLQLEPAALRSVEVHSQVQANASILVLEVEGPDPKSITLLANNMGQNAISFIKSIYQVYDISLLEVAVEPKTPYHPRPLADGLIAAGIGLVVGLMVVVLRDSLQIPLKALRERSLTDRQSLAYTRKYMVRTMTQELVKNRDESFAFGLIRLQGLEDLIDGLPERITTVIMQDVVRKLRALLRGNDIVARWDRLVFSALLPSTPEMAAGRTFERLLLALQEPLTLETGDAISLNAVAGLAIREAGDTADQMTQRAEDALNQAGAGENKMVIAKQSRRTG